MATTTVTPSEYSARIIGPVEEVPIELLLPSRLNPRTHFFEPDLRELGESIRSDGLLEPLVVRDITSETIEHHGRGETPDDAYLEIIAGERRYRAARLVGLRHLAVRNLGSVDDATALRLALTENLQRRDLDPIEEAEGYRQLSHIVGLTQAEIAAAVRRRQPAVAKAMGLLELPEDVQEMIRSGRLSVSHGVILDRWHAFPAVCSAIAKRAADEATPTKELAKPSLPFSPALEKAGLVRALDFQTHFDRAICLSCPFQAYRASALYGRPLCLRPEHYDELQVDADRARRVAGEEEATQRGIHATADTLLSTQDMTFGQYERVRPDDRPAGCSDSCPCNSAALGYGGELTTICTDPERYRAFWRQEIENRRQAETVAIEAHWRDLEDRMDAMAELSPQAAALIVDMALQGVHSNANIVAAAARHVPDLPAGAVTAWGWQRDGAMQRLAAVPVDSQLRFAIEAVLRSQIQAHRGHDEQVAALLTRVLGTPEEQGGGGLSRHCGFGGEGTRGATEPDGPIGE